MATVRSRSRLYQPVTTDTLELLGDELLDLRRVVRLDQLLDPGLVLVRLTHRDDVGVGGFGAFPSDGVGQRVEAGFDRVVGIDRRGIHVTERAGKLRRVQFDDAELLRVLDDVDRRRLQPGLAG